MHRAAERRAWLERVVGKSFAERAKGKPWEAEATAFVAAAFERWLPRSIYENDAELAERGRQVLSELKCDDPLVRCLTGRLAARASYDAFWHWQGISDQMGLFRGDFLEAAGRIERTLDDLEKLGTPRGFLAIVAQETGWQWNRVNDAGRGDQLRAYAAQWLGEALADGSYAIPGPEEDLLIEDALGEPGWRNLKERKEEFRAAVEKAPLSEWARIALIAGCDWGQGMREQRSGNDPWDRGPVITKFAQSWKLHPTAPEPAQLGSHLSWYHQSPDGASHQEWFDRVLGAQFDWFAPYSNIITWLRPDWTGSVEEESAFGRACVATKRFDTAVPLYFLDVLKRITMSEEWRPICRTPENGAALLELGRGLLAEPSRRGQEPLWKSLAAVWAWIGGKDREAAEALAALPGGALHPMALQELRFFRATPQEMRGELAVRLSPAREEYEQGEAFYRELKLAEARDAYTRALAGVGGDEMGKTWLRERLALTEFEIGSRKGEWMKVPLDVALWDIRAGKWSNSTDGALVLEGEERTAFARFRGRVGLDWEMRGEFGFTVPEGGPRHPELGLAYRCYRVGNFLQASTWQDGDQLAVALRQGIWTPRINAGFPVLPPEVRVPLRDITRYLLKTDAHHVTLDLNGEMVWDNLLNHEYNFARDENRFGFVAREPGARNLITIRSLEIRRLPSTPVQKAGATAPE
ncbi:MAG: hypothetical protein QOE70_684 [Chthoniobacter sp.]|jgi:hypothetical protein|nr:hypothetical protein [Chthoniobacter sp.]